MRRQFPTTGTKRKYRDFLLLRVGENKCASGEFRDDVLIHQFPHARKKESQHFFSRNKESGSGVRQECGCLEESENSNSIFFLWRPTTMPGAKIREPRRTFSLPSCGGVKAGQEFKLSRLLRPKEERKRNPWHRSARRSYYCSLPCFAHGERGDLSTFQSTTQVLFFCVL